MNRLREVDLSQLQPGFAEPVRDAQRCFRGILHALAHPGRVTALEDLPQPPPGLGAAQSAVLLALADQDTPLWLPPPLRTAAAGHYLRFHCGCPLVERMQDAHFVLLGSLAELPPLDALRLGEPAFPDRSATLLIEVPMLDAGGTLHLSGPGIQNEVGLAVGGWTAACSDFLRHNRSRFPLGVDLLLTCDQRLAGVPRTVRITPEN